MSNKVKIKLKRGKAKIKLKGGHEPLPLSAGQLQELLGAVVYAASTEPARLSASSTQERPRAALLKAGAPEV